MCGKWLVSLVIAASLGRLSATEYLLFVGACDDKGFLNDLLFENIGKTQSGAPFFKAVGQEQYIYWDPNCAGQDQEIPARWIVSARAPSLTRAVDLDQDRDCKYHARFDSDDRTKPPSLALWNMYCRFSWTSMRVYLASVTTTSITTTTKTTTTRSTTRTTWTSTSTTSTTSITTTTRTATSITSSTTTTRTTWTATATTTTTTLTTKTSSTGTQTTSTTTTTSTWSTSTASTSTVSTSTKTLTTSTQTTSTQTTTKKIPLMLLLKGACFDKAFLNYMVFRLQDVRAANGAPIYKALDGEHYIYYDLDCNGGVDGIGNPRWIIDTDPPNSNRSRDLDGDGSCTYIARMDSDDGSEPPRVATWQMFCAKWQKQLLTLEPIDVLPSTTTTPGAPSTTAEAMISGDAFLLSGACDLQSELNGAFVLQGSTHNGIPFYKNFESEHYMYFDPDCNGGSDGVARWIIDLESPNTQRSEDLDGDGECTYLARTNSRLPRPPLRAKWFMYCKGGWQETPLTLVDVNASTIMEQGYGIPISASGPQSSVAVSFFAVLCTLAFGSELPTWL